MKLKNKYIFVSALACAGLALTSCNDILDVDHPSQMDNNFVFKNTEYATTALNGIYTLFCEDPYTSRMSNAWMQNTDVEAYNPTEGRPQGSHRADIWALQAAYDASFGDIYKAWNNCYQAIEQANNVIEGCETSPVASDAEMVQIKGEAICLKAYRYLLLCNFWGDVPYYDTPSEFGKDLDKPRADRNLIYSKLLQQLINVEEGMKFSDVNTGGTERCTRDFALGLIAKIALFRAGYGMTADGKMQRADDYLDVENDDDLAVIYSDNNGQSKTARTYKDYYELCKFYCQKLIDLKGRNLRTDYAGIFEDQENKLVKNNDEILYQVAFVINRGGDVGWCIGTANTNSKSYGTTTLQVGFCPTYYMSFADNDIRRDVTCARFSHDNDTIKPIAITAMGVNKWDRYDAGPVFGYASGSSKGTGINWPVMRYSEVLLMLAEAENELNGPTQLAKDQLLLVRSRAFPGDTYVEDVYNYVDSVSANKDMFFNAIVNERAWEFGGECLRRFDLIRWNLYGDKINAAVREMNAWGISTNQELLNDPTLAAQYPEAKNYTNRANILYFMKDSKTTDKTKLYWINDKYALTDSAQIENLGKTNQVNWGKAMLKSVTSYTIGAKTYSTAPTKTVNAAEGTSTYTFTDTVVVVRTGEPTGITKTIEYKCCDQAARMFRGYTGDNGVGTGTVPYLLPIGTTTISSSSVLSNDGYMFGTSHDYAGTNYTFYTKQTEYK